MFYMLLSVTLIVQSSAREAQTETAIRIEVRSAGDVVSGAEVTIAGRTYVTDAAGVATANVAPGSVKIDVLKKGYLPLTSSVIVAAGQNPPILVELERQPTLEEEVIVAATRTNKRVEDQPMRVEVVPGEEV